YFFSYAAWIASSKRSPLVFRTRTLIFRFPISIAPTGFFMNSRYQPVFLSFHERINARSLTKTTQMSVNPCSFPARIPIYLLSFRFAKTCFENRFGTLFTLALALALTLALTRTLALSQILLHSELHNLRDQAIRNWLI